MPYQDPPFAITGQGLSSTDWNNGVFDSIIDVAKPPRARVRRTTAFSVPNNVVTIIPWEVEEYDSGGLYDPVTPNRFTVPASMNGWTFHVGLCGQFATNGTGARHLSIMRNGLVVAAFNGGGNAAWTAGAPVGTDYPANTGDFFQASAYQTSGAALNLDVTHPVAFWIRVVARA